MLRMCPCLYALYMTAYAWQRNACWCTCMWQAHISYVWHKAICATIIFEVCLCSSIIDLIIDGVTWRQIITRDVCDKIVGMHIHLIVEEHTWCYQTKTGQYCFDRFGNTHNCNFPLKFFTAKREILRDQSNRNRSQSDSPQRRLETTRHPPGASCPNVCHCLHLFSCLVISADSP